VTNVPIKKRVGSSSRCQQVLSISTLIYNKLTYIAPNLFRSSIRYGYICAVAAVVLLLLLQQLWRRGGGANALAVHVGQVALGLERLGHLHSKKKLRTQIYLEKEYPKYIIIIIIYDLQPDRGLPVHRLHTGTWKRKKFND
jgi:hypothetical protein